MQNQDENEDVGTTNCVTLQIGEFVVEVSSAKSLSAVQTMADRIVNLVDIHGLEQHAILSK